ncbi:hypothetical protein AUC69_12360 [Methyloceanibacter superfactus]|uniref:Spore protein YkvP/CgeB glycosyl transferase-like domain-containing protein n=2 Tax=Methyloceanibacter superfactus TaxID=1774969 RepID=A0A1E3VV23_9HYPH|nr:hypothetical protein AUC69_12360 [Methyloceanibacter superfactus]
MLTQSDWHREPRSNRYHYATRFAQDLPVYFVQPTPPVETPELGETEIENIGVVHAGTDYGVDQSIRLERLLAKRHVRRPLLFAYNPLFVDFIARNAGFYAVYHATEDYFGSEFDDAVRHREMLMRVLGLTDLLVACTDGVFASYRINGAYRGRSIVLKNGCDFEFWRRSDAIAFQPQASGRPAALYQGALNDRLDFDLLSELADRVNDWDLVFCGRDSDEPGWTRLREKPNVRYLGELRPEQIAETSRQSSVGLIPFRDYSLARVSLPLKAFEYVACGLPVVSTPIDELARDPELFSIASDAAEFESAIRQLADTRDDSDAIGRRQAAAAQQSYDKRFSELREEIDLAMISAGRNSDKYNILVLYDDRSTHVKAIKDHLHAFSVYSSNGVTYLPCTGAFMTDKDKIDSNPWDFDCFDVIVIHHSVRVCYPDHLNRIFYDSIARFTGLKVLFVQDDYNNTGHTWQFIEQIGFDVVFTSVPDEFIPTIYPCERFPRTEFLHTLTGYVPELEAEERDCLPISERPLRIVYRGRSLPLHYGDLAREKLDIGLEVKRRADARSVPVDIEVDNASRIYGADWYRFLASARAMLGTESGSNVFDFDGSLAELSKANADMPYEQFRDRYLAGREGPVMMNQVSPKLFEAIHLRTALVLFEGAYSGILERDVHYISLKKDYSNIDDVFDRLEDVAFLEKMADRAYRDIISSRRYSYERFIANFDALLNRRLLRSRRCQIIEAPIMYERKDRELFAIPMNEGPVAALLSRGILAGPTTRDELLAARVVRRSYRNEFDTLKKAQKSLSSYERKIERLSRTLERRTRTLEKRDAKIERLSRMTTGQQMPIHQRVMLAIAFRGRAYVTALCRRLWQQG